MYDRAKEEENLAQANGHIAEAEAKISAQKQRIAEIQTRGQDTELANELLSTMLEVLRVYKLHRAVILARLGRNE